MLQSNTNDGLVAMLLVYTMLALRSPAGERRAARAGDRREVLPGGARAADRRRHRRPRGPARWPHFASRVRGRCAWSAVYVVLPDGGVRELWDDTIGYQLGRESPFSLWGLHPSLGWLQTLVEAGTAALCLAVAFVPRRRDARQVAALAAAIVIALQLCATYWLFFYVSWFAPLALVAMFAYRIPGAGARTEVGILVQPEGRR